MLYNPAWFQGDTERSGYFEGWYFKLVDSEGNRPLAVIPGISLDKNGHDSHAFIQLLDGGRSKSAYFRFPLSEFKAAKDKFSVQIGKNQFSNNGIILDLKGQSETVTGEIRFGPLKPWPITSFSVGAMGPFAFLPRMECYHGVLSFDHSLSGRLKIGSDQIDYSNGHGYMEKDWGHSMPTDWIWIQCNNFEISGTSLSLSVARVPWLGFAFNGFVIGLLHQGKLYRFTTYTGAKVKRVKYLSNGVSLEIEDHRYRLIVKSEELDLGAELASPIVGKMKGRIKEHLPASVSVTLKMLSNDAVIFAGISKLAGLEIVGTIKI